MKIAYDTTRAVCAAATAVAVACSVTLVCCVYCLVVQCMCAISTIYQSDTKQCERNRSTEYMYTVLYGHNIKHTSEYEAHATPKRQWRMSNRDLDNIFESHYNNKMNRASTVANTERIRNAFFVDFKRLRFRLWSVFSIAQRSQSPIIECNGRKVLRVHRISPLFSAQYKLFRKHRKAYGDRSAYTTNVQSRQTQRAEKSSDRMQIVCE